tara:strand:- start:1274 stop:2173 length:900 start_codon:yes stop_codon:yes gene_type:complete
MMRFRKALTCVLILLVLIPTSTGHGTESDDEAASIHDVKTFDIQCALTNETCIASSTTHLIEYFSADWCEPCDLVSAELNALNRTDVTVLQHHPSPLDLHFLSDSKFRFETTYGFWGVPDLVLNGEGLLTGPSQSQELDLVLDNFSREWSGFTSISLNNGTLSWISDDGDEVHVWITENGAHEINNQDQINVVHHHIAIGSENQTLDISNFINENTTNIVVTLESPGRFELRSASTLSSQGYSLIDEESDQNGLEITKQGREYDMAIAVFGLSMAAFIPALIMYVRIVRNEPVLNDESE